LSYKAIKAIYAHRNIHRIIPFFVIIAAVALVYFFPQDDTRTLLIFAVLLIVFIIYKYDIRLFVLFSVVLLATGGVFMAAGSNEVTSRVAIISYWLLVFAVIGIVIDSLRKRQRVKQEN